MKTLIALVGAIVALLWSSAAVACQCQDTRDRDESYRTAAYVFYGEAIDKDGEVALKVKTNFKGSRAKRTHAIEQSGDCAFQFEVGKKYIVFAAKGEGKRVVKVDACGATAQLDHAPLTAFVWSLADELAYKTPRKAAERHRKARNTITARAVRKVKAAARACDEGVWKGKDEMKARIEARFDVQPDGTYSVELLKYETGAGPNDEIRSCLAKNLAEDNFKKFPGGRVSVSAYWLIDRLDASFGEDRSSSTVLAYKSSKRLLE